MSGLLGFMAAGAAQGFAEGRTNEIKQQQEFDLKRALLDAQTEKEMLMQERGIKLKEDAEQRYRDKITSIVNSVEDPMAGKGGYEPEEDKQKREISMAAQRADKLRAAGYINEANSYETIVDRYNKGEISKANLENEINKINNEFALKTKDLELKEQKNQTALAKIEAANNKKDTYKPTDSDKAYDSYVQQMKSENKKPLSRYQFENWMESKKASFKNGKDSDIGKETIKTTDVNNAGNTIRERTVTKPLSKDKIGRYVPGKGVVFD